MHFCSLSIDSFMKQLQWSQSKISTQFSSKSSHNNSYLLSTSNIINGPSTYCLGSSMAISWQFLCIRKNIFPLGDHTPLGYLRGSFKGQEVSVHLEDFLHGKGDSLTSIYSDKFLEQPSRVPTMATLTLPLYPHSVLTDFHSAALHEIYQFAQT